MSERVDAARRAVRKVIRDARDKNKWRKIVRFRLWMPVALQIVLVATLLWYTNSRFPGFVNATNVSQILILALPLIVAAIAQTHALLVGYLDLSVGGMIGLGVVIASFLIGAESSAVQIVLGIAVILLCGAALGLVNAGLIRGLKIPSIIATLATLSILDGISLTMRPTAQGVINADFVSALTTTIGPIPVAFIVIVAAAALADVWLHASGSGLQLRAVGFDERSAKRGGVRTNWIRVRALLLSAVLAAVAAFFVMARSPIGNATVGSTFALNSITAAVLGGASLAGGRATFIGSTVAAILLALIITVLPYLGLSPDDGPMIIGVLVLIGIVLFQLGDIKELVKRNYKRARRLVLGSRPPKAAELPAFYPTGTDFGVVPSGRTLIRGGTVLSLDPELGDLPTGDVLIEGERILAVGPDLANGEVELIDASGMIVMPGFVDSHRHIWEGLLRNIGTDVPLEGRTSYISFVLHKLAPGSPRCSTGPTSRIRRPTPTQ
jgi:ribose/xylose/arabinose/galactoside ABC-type transport system permease subunit